MDYQNMFAVCMRLTLHYFILLWQTNSTSGLAEAEFVTDSPDVTIYTQVQCLGNEWAGRFIFTVYLHVCTMYIYRPSCTNMWESVHMYISIYTTGLGAPAVNTRIQS